MASLSVFVVVGSGSGSGGGGDVLGVLVIVVVVGSNCGGDVSGVVGGRCGSGGFVGCNAGVLMLMRQHVLMSAIVFSYLQSPFSI